MYRYVIVESSGGYEIYVNLITSSAGRYLSRQPYLLGLLREVLTPIKLRGAEVSTEHEMGRVIGNTHIIETSEKDVVFYAQPYKKTIFSRYAKHRYPSPSEKLTTILRKDAEGNYELCDTWIGPCSPPFPGDEREISSSKQYWESHALIEETKEIQPKTITKVCPY